MRNRSQEYVAELEAAHPGWQVWVVDRYIGGPLYCARRWDGTGKALNAISPEALDGLVREAGQE